MPRIPMADKAGMIQHVNGAVHMQGAPGLNWKLEEGQSLINMGEKIGRGMERLGNSVTEFERQMQHKEDVLAATEDRNLFKKLNGELEVKLANTPGATDQQKQDWINGYKQMYEDGRAEILNRMSGDFRKQHEAEMNGFRIDADNRRIGLLKHGKVQRATDLALARLKDAGLRGDLTEYRRILDEVQEGVPLFSEERKKILELEYNRLSAYGEVKRQVDADAPGIIGKLKERDKDGNYVNYTGLAAADRDRFIRVAEANDAKKRSDENQELVDMLHNGYQVTVEDIEQKFEGQDTPEAIRQKNQQRKIVENFISRQASRRAEGRKGQVDADEYKLLAYNFSSDPAVRQKQYSELKNAIFVKYAGDGASTKKLLTQLNEAFKAKTNPDSSYKNSYIYAYGNKLLDKMKGDFYSRYHGRGESGPIWSFFSNVYNDDEDLKAANWKMAKVAFDDFVKRNPGASDTDVKDFLNNLKKDVNWAECDKIMEFWRDRKTPRVGAGKTDVNGVNGENGAATQAGGEIERDVNGRIAIFGADHKFIRWKDGK